MASLAGFEPTTRCLEVIQRTCFLVTLKLNCCFLPIPVLASKPPFSTPVYNSISAKLVPIFYSGNRCSARGIDTPTCYIVHSETPIQYLSEIDVLAELDMRCILNMGRKTKRSAVFYSNWCAIEDVEPAQQGKTSGALNSGRGGFL